MAQPVKFAEMNVVWKGGEGVGDLPAHNNTLEGSVTTCWELTPEELEQVKNNGGRIYLKTWTGNHPFQPVQLSALPIQMPSKGN